MRKKSGFFRRKLCSPQSFFDSNVDDHLGDVASPPSHPDGRPTRQSPAHEPHRHKGSAPPVPAIPPSFQAADLQSIDHSSNSTRTSSSYHSSNPKPDSAPTPASYSFSSEESPTRHNTRTPVDSPLSPTAHTHTLPSLSRLQATLHQEFYPHNLSSTSDHSTGGGSILLEPFAQSFRSSLGSSSRATCEPPMSPPSHVILPSLSSRAIGSNRERSDPLCPRATQPHPTNCFPYSLSITRAASAPLAVKTIKSSPSSPPLPSSTPSLTTGADQQQPGPSHSPRGLPFTPLFPNSTSLQCRPNLSNSDLTEEDKLRLSLEPWKLDQDGVLQGGLLSPQALKAYHANPKTFLKPQNSSLLIQYNLAKQTLSDSSIFPLSSRLPSLVNPKRTAMQSRAPAETSNRPATCPDRIKIPDADPPRSTSDIPSFSPVVSALPEQTLSRGSVSPNPSIESTSSVNLSISTVVQSPQNGVSRASSMKESRDLGADRASSRVKLRRRGYTQDCSGYTPDNDALAPTYPESQSPVDSIQSSGCTLPSSQHPSQASSPPSQAASTKEPASEGDDSEINDPPLPQSPTIRLVSSSAQAAVPPPETSDSAPSSRINSAPNSQINSAPSSQIFPSSPPSSLSSPKLSQSVSFTPQALQRPSVFERDTPSKFSASTSPTAKGRSKLTNPGLLKRGGHSNQINPSAALQLLQRAHLEQASSIKHSSKPEERRTPRSHQSSPNLRNLRSPTPPDLSFFSVVVSGPAQSGDKRTSVTPSEPENSTVNSASTSCQSSASSLNLNSSLIIPGMTLESNAIRLAEMFWQEDESIIKRQKLTEWLGSPESNENHLQVLTRKAFLNKFDFKDLRIDSAFRKLCSKLYLKGETQQVDRILAEFSRRYWEQNQSHIYVNPDMVHALSYSILLLNTDLHVVDTVSRMSRSQFIRNTMETIGVQLTHLDHLDGGRSVTSKDFSRPSLDLPSTTSRANHQSTHRSRQSSIMDIARSPLTSITSSRPSMERWREALWSDSHHPNQSSPQRQSITSCSSEDEIHIGEILNQPMPEPSPPIAMMDHRSSLDAIVSSTPESCRADEGIRFSSLFLNSHENESTIPIGRSDKSSKAQFEKELETLLKDIYAAIKTHPIAQILVDSHQHPTNYGSLQRISSRRTQHPYANTERNVSSKRASLRGFGGFSAMLSVGADGPGARSNSPTPSASTSFSSGVMGYSSNAGSSLNLTNVTTPSIGFVSNLSQSIIREQNEDETSDAVHKIDEQACDSELALLGAPWAKEGLLQRKQYWESKGKRHKDRAWAEVFVVIQAGTLQMFQFGGQSVANKRPGGSEVSKSSSESNEKVTVGGGNWLPNAQLMGEISLSHALTSVLVSGYSKDRSHVFVLTLSNGASYFFQTGTQELVHEWVSTCNYWAARLSKEPLTGGVSNMEYGWNQIVSMDLIGPTEKKDEGQECQQDQEEMMSIVSGHSGHSQKARSRLRDRLLNGLPLGNTILSTQVAHSARVGDLHNWSTSSSSFSSPPLSSPAGSKSSSDRPHLPSPVVPEKVSVINEWNPPVPPMALSTLGENAQFEHLKRHNAHIQMELEKHNLLRKPIIQLYWNRPTYLQKAMSNWEKKAQYLMAEVIKYTTYFNALELAIQVKQNLATAGSG